MGVESGSHVPIYVLVGFQETKHRFGPQHMDNYIFYRHTVLKAQYYIIKKIFW